jgi:hypothetical protein
MLKTACLLRALFSHRKAWGIDNDVRFLGLFVFVFVFAIVYFLTWYDCLSSSYKRLPTGCQEYLPYSLGGVALLPTVMVISHGLDKKSISYI